MLYFGAPVRTTKLEDDRMATYTGDLYVYDFKERLKNLAL